MMPMANKLQAALDSATFGYTEEDFQQDLNEIEHVSVDDTPENAETADIKTKVIAGGKKLTGNFSGLFSKKKSKASATTNEEDIFETLKKLSELKESGILSQEEFDSKKAELLSKI